MPKFIDLTGKKFNYLTVLERVPNCKGKDPRWKCRCECGNFIIAQSNNLKSENTTNCGCIRKKKTIERSFKHGMSYTSEFHIWTGMISRCYNPKNEKYKIYGGRGITVCDEWRNDFMAFFNHVGKKPSPKHSIDRIDNNGNYEPGNVHWATPKEQANNCRSNNKITINGITLNLSQWAKFVGMSRTVLNWRINKGWPPEKAISQAVRKMNK